MEQQPKITQKTTKPAITKIRKKKRTRERGLNMLFSNKAHKFPFLSITAAAYIVRLAITLVVLALPVILFPHFSAISDARHEQTDTPAQNAIETTPAANNEYTAKVLSLSQPSIETLAGSQTIQQEQTDAPQPKPQTDIPEKPPDYSPAASSQQPWDDATDIIHYMNGVPPEPPEPKLPAIPPEPPEPMKVAYITIDDGPSRAITPGILDVLQREEVPATFFVLPHQGLDDIYMRIIEEGHEIGNHSYSHNYTRLYSSHNIEAFKDDIIMARDFILENFGYLTTSFRFPGGSGGRSSAVIISRREVLAELGYRDFNWQIDSGDASPHDTDKSADGIVSQVLSNTRNREHLIILFHDTASKRTTLEALPRIISGLREQGYTFDIIRNYPIS